MIEKLEIFRTSTADLDDKTEMFLKKRNEKIAFSRNEKIEYKSNAELRIAKFLENEKIEFEYQYTDPDCKDIKELPYDFAIKYKEKIICFVESDGEHHFRPIKRTKEESNEESIERLETIRKHDRIKDENAVNKNIPIIRIPYWLFEKIEIILAKELTKLTILN